MGVSSGVKSPISFGGHASSQKKASNNVGPASLACLSFYIILLWKRKAQHSANQTARNAFELDQDANKQKSINVPGAWRHKPWFDTKCPSRSNYQFWILFSFGRCENHFCQGWLTIKRNKVLQHHVLLFFHFCIKVWMCHRTQKTMNHEPLGGSNTAADRRFWCHTCEDKLLEKRWKLPSQVDFCYLNKS